MTITRETIAELKRDAKDIVGPATVIAEVRSLLNLADAALRLRELLFELDSRMNAQPFVGAPITDEYRTIVCEVYAGLRRSPPRRGRKER